jgi:DNA topoisomerase-1
MTPNEVTLELALGLLSLPREIGAHPETGAMVLAGIGRFGPYLKLGPAYTSIPAGDDVLAIGLNRAVTLIAEKALKSPPAKQIGESGGKPVTVHSGRYGPYVQLGQVRATLPKDVEQETITLEKALELIAAKAAKGPTKPEPKTIAKATKKLAAKKTAAKKPAKKKTGVKKSAAKAKPGAAAKTGIQPDTSD